jgi:hypothetical protein
MKSFEAKVTNLERLPTYRINLDPVDRSKVLKLTLWRMSVSYLAEDEVYEIELSEPLKRFACTEYSVGTNGLVQFDMYAVPPLSAGDRIQIDAYKSGERGEEIPVNSI